MKVFLLIIVSLSINNQSYSQINYGNYTSNPNNRSEVINDSKPCRYICHIIVNRRHTINPSTAFLVSPVQILLFEYYENGINKKLLADISYNRDQLKFGSHPDYCGNGCPEYDFGFIKLPTDTLYRITGGYFVVSEFDSLKNKVDSLYITGYPKDKQKMKDGSLWTKGDKAINVTSSPDYLTYGIYTEEGDSGAPIWAFYNDVYYVVGIHNKGFNTCNGGRKINQLAKHLIESWDKQ